MDRGIKREREGEEETFRKGWRERKKEKDQRRDFKREREVEIETDRGRLPEGYQCKGTGVIK